MERVIWSARTSATRTVRQQILGQRLMQICIRAAHPLLYCWDLDLLLHRIGCRSETAFTQNHVLYQPPLRQNHAYTNHRLHHNMFYPTTDLSHQSTVYTRHCLHQTTVYTHHCSHKTTAYANHRVYQPPFTPTASTPRFTPTAAYTKQRFLRWSS